MRIVRDSVVDVERNLKGENRMVTYPENETIINCNFCSLSGINYAFPRIVRGNGPKIMFIGEAPGEEEAKHHIAFIGDSGKLLNEWISKLGLDNYVITNAVKHRPIRDDGYNGTPTIKQIQACVPYLFMDIDNESPDYIVILGRTAVKSFGELINKSSLKLFDDKDQFPDPSLRMIDIIDYTLSNNTTIFVLYHPSYILRTGYNMDSLLKRLREKLEAKR